MTVPKLSVASSGMGGRGYARPGTKEIVPGVTTVLGALDKPGLINWNVTQTAAYAVTHLDDLANRTEEQGIGFLRYKTRPSQKKITETLDQGDDAMLEYSGLVLNDLAELGTFIHSYIEADLNDWFTPDPVNHIHVELIEAWHQWRSEHTIEPLFTEATVYGTGYAGTADFFGKVDGVMTCLDFKGLPLDTRIPTPTGWTTMSQIQVGDSLFDEAGNVTQVSGKSDVKNVDCYELTFDTGETVVCDADHRWVVNVGESAKSKRVVLTAREMEERGIAGKHGQKDLRVPLAKPLDLPTATLPLDPYVLGVWLGDGTRTKNEVTLNATTKAGIPAEVARRGWQPEIVTYPSDRATGGVRYRFGPAGEWNSSGVSPFKKALQDIGAFGTKSIPTSYMRASYAQRLDLLRGLMDTDGGWNIGRNGEVCIATTDRDSAQQYLELVSSLGERVRMFEHDASWTHKGVRKTTRAFQVRWRPVLNSPFLAREYPYALRPAGQSGRRLITKVQRVESVPTQCIEVSSEKSTFLFGDTMIVTHNTSRAVYDSHESQLAALGAAETMFREVAEGTPGAIYYELPASIAKTQGGVVDSWWLEEGVPGFQQYAVLQIRPDDDDKGRFAKMHVIDQQIIDAGWTRFQGALMVKQANRAADLRRKELGYDD